MQKESVWVKIFSTNNEVYANIVKGFLEGVKIRCSLYRNESFNAYPKNTLPSDEIEVMVHPKHFIKAVGIVAKLRGKLNEARSAS